ncbi:MAG: hypothetical protein HY231_16230, partial [Acidobacteria bacterium]|nr:hypothetical protein [Acidobacteriota bacterium]
MIHPLAPPAQLGGQTTFAFAPKVTNALNQSAYTQFDYWTGKSVNGQDANGVVSSGRYAAWSDGTHADALDRASELEIATNYPVNSGIRRRTRFAYDDANKVITTTSDHTAFNDGVLKGEIVYDGLGRTIESRQYETSSTFIKTTSEYDAMGRPFRVSNPFRSGD